MQSYNRRVWIAEIEKSQWDEALKLVKEVFMEFEAPDYPEEGIAEFMHTISDERFLDEHARLAL